MIIAQLIFIIIDDIIYMAEKKPNILFDTLSALFNNKEYIANLTNESIRQNIFMINRRLAIQYPLQAQVFNNSKVNPIDVLKFWSDFLYTGRRPPGWIYTAGAAKSQAKKNEKSKITSAMIKDYSLKHNISQKDVLTLVRFFSEELLAEITEYEELKKQINSYEKNNL